MVIDFHTHAFPEKIVARAIDTLAKTSGNVIPFSDGTVDGLLHTMDEGGVDRSVVLNIATNEGQMSKVNDFAISIDGYAERLISFGSVYPGSGAALEELHRLHEAGVRGIKLHPEYQDFFVDDDRMTPVYELLGQLGMITVFHSGLDNGFMGPVHCTPQRVKAMLPAFGGAPVVLAHMGGYILWNEVLEVLAGLDGLYFDTSFCYSRIPMPLCRAIIERHGAEHILFGSDSPWSPPRLERRLVEGLSLPDESVAAVMGGNACRLLKM